MCDSNGDCYIEPSLIISAELVPTTIIYVNHNQQVILNGSVICQSGHCGQIFVKPEMGSGDAINPMNLSVQYGDANNGNRIDCSPMSASGTSTCKPNWRITGLKAGYYYLRITTQDSAMYNTSNSVLLEVREIQPGVISVGLSAVSAKTKGTTSNVTATVHCDKNPSYPDWNAYCGNITVYLNNGDKKISSNVADKLFSSSPNPQSPSTCNLENDKSCQVVWELNSSDVGSFTLYAIADSDKILQNSSQSIALNVTEVPIGVLTVDNVSLPVKANVGGSVELSADIVCRASDSESSVSCGNITVYSVQNGSKITADSSKLSVQSYFEDRAFSNMSSGTTYRVAFNITAKSEGYYLLQIAANSSLIDNAIGGANLSVVRNAGVLSVNATPAEMAINVTGTAVIYANVTCSTADCGNVTVDLSFDPTAGVSILGQGANPQKCSYPCNLNWTIKGNVEGSYTLNITASSDASKYTTTTAHLDVMGDNPFLSINPTNLNDIKSAIVGKDIQITATVRCSVQNCGDITAVLWGKILNSSDTIYLLDDSQNVRHFSLLAGQYIDLNWTANFKETGAHVIGISANGSAPRVINRSLTKTLDVKNKSISIVILSPEENEAFPKGDTIYLKAYISSEGIPVPNLYPVIATLPPYDFLTTILYDDGKHYDNLSNDGIYGGTLDIPASIPTDDPRYTLIFQAENYESRTNILVDPTLSITAKTNSNSYSSGDNIIISGSVSRKGKPVAASMTVRILLDGKDKDEKTFDINGSYSYSYQNNFVQTSDSKLEFEILASDNYTNTGRKSVNVTLNAFKGETLNISLQTDKGNYSRNERMAITTKVFYLGQQQSGVNVSCKFIGNDIQLKETGDSYKGEYRIPANARLSTLPLICFVNKPKPGEVEKYIKIEPMRLNITIISPKPISDNPTTIYVGNVTNLKVIVKYPDGKPVVNGSIQIISGNQPIVNMVYIGNGTYIAEGMRGSASGVTSFMIQAQDASQNNGTNNVTAVFGTYQGSGMEWLLLIPAGIAIAFFVWYYYMKTREDEPPPKIQIQEKIIRLPMRERVREVVYRPIRMPVQQRRIDPVTRLRLELDKLEERKRTTESAKELAEQQYYKRQIDESTFNKLMQDYEEKLIEMDAAIKQKKKELYGAD
jgi:hypothetical protein